MSESHISELRNIKLNFLRGSLLIFLLGLLSACGGNSVEVTTFLGNGSKVEKGAAVYFENAQVGQVSDVVEEASGSRIALSLDNEIAEQISRKSAVVVNNLKQGAPLEIYNPASDDSGEFLVSGQEIKGLDSMFQLGAWKVGDAFQAGSGTVNQYVKAFQDYLTGEQFEQDKAAVKSKVDEASKAATEAMSDLEEDISLTINEMTMTEDEMVAAVQELGDGLSPLVQELSKTGVQLMQELERFALSLENTTPEQKQSGEKFMQSLEETLEELNNAIEKGAEQADSGSSKPD